MLEDIRRGQCSTMFGIRERDLDDAINNSLLRSDMNSFCEDMKKSGSTLSGDVDPDSLQREKERILRSQLDSSDGLAVDLHDQVVSGRNRRQCLFDQCLLCSSIGITNCC